MITFIEKENEDYRKSLKWLVDQTIVAVDTEANGLNPVENQILLLQVGNEARQFVYDVHSLGKEATLKILSTLSIPTKEKIIHNASYDYSMIKGNYGISLTNMKDTMIANQLLIMGKRGIRSGLDAVLAKFLNIHMDKDTRAQFLDRKPGTKFTQEEIDYAGLDVKYLIPLYREIQKLLDNRGMNQLSQLEYLTTKITGDMKVNGIYIDQEKWRALKDVAEKEGYKARIKLDELFAPHCEKDMFGNLFVKKENISKSKKTNLVALNYDSPTQIKPILEKITGKTLDSTGAEVLENLEHPVSDLLLTYRESAKRVSTYGDAFLEKNVDSDGRIRCDFFQLGTDSGRYSSKNPNMQNIPSLQIYRDPFCAQGEDYRIISADFSGQELRLLAQVSQEPKFIEALKEGKDLHSYSASLLFDIPYDDFLEKDENGNIIMEDGEPKIKKEMKAKYRNPAKAITFGLIYGMGPYKLANNLKISFEEAKDLMKKYFETFPEIKKTMERFSIDVRKNRYAFSPLDKRRRDLTQIDWDDPKKVGHAINQAKNLPFQGAGASVTKLAMCYIDREITKNNLDAKILLTVHDEILVECHKDIAEKVANIVKTKMEEAFNFYAPDVPMQVQAIIDTRWIH